MSTLDVPNNSAMMKRAEQLKRWEESDTNRAAPTPRRTHNGRHIKFSSGCVFLAACLSGDKDDVLQLIDDGADINTANVDGLTALHQACIDDKLEMVEFLVTHGADINRQDNEGWTPLHATASCGFVSIAQYLVENHADVAAVNSDGDLALDLAIDVQHMPMIDYMEKVVQELNIDVDQARKAEEKAMLNDANKWLLSDATEVDRPNPKTGATALHVAAAKGYTNVLSLLLAGRANVDRQDNDGWTPLHAAAHWGQKETAEMLVESWANMDIRNYAGQSCIDVADRKMVKFLEELRANKRNKRRPSSQIRISDAIENHVDKTPTKLVRVEVRTDAAKDAENVKPNQQIHAAEHSVEDEAPWRRKTLRTPNDSPTKNQVPDKELSGKSGNESANDVILRRTHSFENDQKKPIAPVAMLNAATTTTPTTTVLSSPSTTVHTPPIRSNPAAQSSSNSNNNGSTTASAVASEVETPKPKQSAGNIFKNFFKSFVPPVRDEESETQRKAHAKRVRETRRSTQGVTLDEIKSAEELVKKKNLGMNKNNNNNNNNSSSFKLEDITSGGTYPPNQSTIIPSAPAVMAAVNLANTAGAQRRISSGPNALNASNQSLNSVGRPVSAPSETINNSAYMTPPARRYETTSAATTTATTTANNSASAAASANHATASSATTSHVDKDNDKENDNRTQTVIQRRRKPKRRSTGVVHLDMDELDPERQHESANNDNDEKEKESGSERTSRSRTASTATTSAASDSKSTSSSDKAENGDGIDYKALWEAAKMENDKLKQMLKQKDDEVVQTRATLERFANATTKNSLSEIEKRERRAMERKLSELEEELKLLQKLKTENDRLRAENRALTRVVSKLTTSAQSQLAKSK
ncbi:protein phosphatase 1 regulatory subunit 12A isoform X10 [Drosophila innubila]|uniref:protein phosphatase 1 regulatory subunit 12A isoform X10 n=1 Tax=Drosophila innubila TaxID=198719 RepID=UPI00148BF0E8|nr:protein phosphatase 1 regulatory subunit 12A isoform X10 [Drosophila innubila]